MRMFIAATMLAAACGVMASEKFRVSSPDIAAGKAMGSAQEYDGFGCKGANLSPALNWQGAPQGTKSYAVTMYDKDAPTGSGWWHWIMIDIPPTASGVPSGAGNPSRGGVAGASLRRNDFGAAAYGGACPPPGSPAHRYTIKVFALDVARLEVPQDGSAALVGYMLNQHALATAQIETIYRR